MGKHTEGFCQTCDQCTGDLVTKAGIKLNPVLQPVRTLGSPECPNCKHRMTYHRGNINYWQKKK